MRQVRLSWLVVVLVVAMLAPGVRPASAQSRIVGSVSGTVQDPTGAVVPSARVVLKDAKTGITKEAASTGEGTFFFPDLPVGPYEITVTAQGFQTAVVTDVNVLTSQTTDVRVSLPVGQTSETVTVVSDTTPQLETSSQLMTNTLESTTISELPLGNRVNALAFARLAPGASPPSGGSTRFNNLPGGAMNITVDGINNASNGFKSGGTVFFWTVRPPLGAIDEVSVETGGLGADSGAQSGANIKFVTKRGGEDYHGSFFYEPVSERFNANTWVRNAQGQSRLYNRVQSYGGNIGGPVLPFGYFKKRFFGFVNFERAYAPIRIARQVSVLTPLAQRGVYTYLLSGSTTETRTADVLALAAARGLPTRPDPVVQSILNVNAEVPRHATQIPDNDLNRDTYAWDATNPSFRYYPTVRLDYYVTPKQQVTFTWNLRHEFQPGEQRLPLPDFQRTNPFLLNYFIWAGALQSTLSTNTFNEFRYGVQHSGDTNARADYGPYFAVNNVPLRIGVNLPFAIADNQASPGPRVPYIDQANVTGRHFITTVYDTLTLNRGQHTYTLGASYRDTQWNDTGEVFQVPTYATGTPNGDPLQSNLAYTTTTLPGINNTLLGDPLALYNLLTGRVASSSFTRVADPETLQYNGFTNYTFTALKMGGAYFQDRWRVRPSLTLNYGLRWEIQGPMRDTKGLTAAPDLASIFGPSVRLFAPGVLSGNNNPTIEVGRTPYKTDWKNFGPTVGFAWNPTFDKGLLGKIFGNSKTVLRGYYGLIYYDEGTQFFAANLGPNVGKTINATTLIPGQPGQTNLPAFYTLSDIVANPLTASSFAFTTTTYREVINQADQTFARTISGFDPTIRTPYTINWNLGVQRELFKNNVLEVRYVGNQAHLAWRTSNLNEVDVFNNGFLNEFRNAQRNLALNQAAGVQSFQNRGLPGQAALPIFDTAFGARGSLAAIAAGQGFASPGFITNLQNGEAGALANTLATNQNYVCRMFGSSFSPCARVLPTANAPGAYPLNFFLLNPFVAGRLNYVDDTGWNSYHAMQVTFRQRLANSVNWTTNYTWSKSLTNLPADNQNQQVDFTTLRDIGLDKRLSPFDITHVLQTFGTIDLPVGRGRWLSLGGNRVADAVIGGWTLGSIFVFNTGQPVQLTGGFQTVNNSNNTATQGVRLAPGVTLEQIEQMFHAPLQRVTGRVGFTDLQRIGVDPRLIGPDGRANPAFILPNTTPGEFGQLLFIRDRNTFQWDLSLTKTFAFRERLRFQLFGSFNNVLNHPRWGLPNTNVFSTSFGVVGAPAGSRTINLRGTLSF